MNDIALSRLGLGCAQLGGLYTAISDSDAQAIVDAAWDAGLRYFDTAPYYGFTLSERRLGAALRQRPRGEYVVSTKVGRRMQPDASVRPGECGWAEPLPFRPHYDYTYDGVLRSHEDSLQRLGLDSIDILYVHDIGAYTHGERHEHYWAQLTHGGGFRALSQLREQGLVRAIGLGVNESDVVVAAMQECALDCTLLAGRYTLLEQSPILDLCAEKGMRIVAGGVFNSGILAGNGMFNYELAPDSVLARVARIDAVCREFQVPMQAAALQFPLAHPAVTSILTGAQSAAQLQQNAAWLAQPIPAAFWQALKHAGLLGEQVPVPEGA